MVSAHPTIEYDDRLKSQQSLSGGKKFVISTKIAGRPTPTAAWSLDGKPIQLTPDLSLQATPTSSQLTFAAITAAQSGKYVLKVENSVGLAEAEFVIVIKGTFEDS